MNPIPFMIAAYGVTFVLTGGLLLVSWRQMSAAESVAKSL